VCNKEQQQQQQLENTTICFQCQDNEEVARVTQNNIGCVSQYVYLRCHSIIQNLLFLISLH
jgi:hypothetical protein